MTSRILVPLDGSALAERALSSAMMLAQGLPADVVLFGAVSISPDYEILGHTLHDVEAHMERLEAEASEYLGRVAARLQKSGLAVRAVVRRGPAAEAIVDYAEKMDIQQIVMATHGYSGISRWRHGSVAERVLQSASAPVLMICAKGGKGVSQEPMACQRILVPLDGSDTAEQVLQPAVSVAHALDAEIVLFRHPHQPPLQAVPEASGLQRFLCGLPIRREPRIGDGEMPEVAMLEHLSSSVDVPGLRAPQNESPDGVGEATSGERQAFALQHFGMTRVGSEEGLEGSARNDTCITPHEWQPAISQYGTDYSSRLCMVR